MLSFSKGDLFTKLLFRKAEGNTTTTEDQYIEKRLAENAACQNIWKNVQRSFKEDFLILLIRQLDGDTNREENLYIERQINKDPLCRQLSEDVRSTFVTDLSKCLLPGNITPAQPEKSKSARLISYLSKQMVLWCILLFALGAAMPFYYLARTASDPDSPHFNKKAVTLELGEGRSINLSSQVTQIVKTDNAVISIYPDSLSITETSPGDSKAWHQINVPRGLSIQVRLSDGTVIHMGPASRLRYPISFDKRSRDLYMEGEAIFDVSDSVRNPFVIHTAGVEVVCEKALVYVETYGRQLKTSVTSGEVYVQRGEKRTFQKAGESLTLDMETGTIEKMPTKNSQLTSWTNGKYVIYGQRLDKVCQLLERLYDVTIILDSEELAPSRYYGIISSKSPLTDVLGDLLALHNGLQYYYDKDKRIHIFRSRSRE